MGTRQNRLTEAVLTSTHNLCFEQKYDKYQNFLSENSRFLVVKFPVYLTRHVFVMKLLHAGAKCRAQFDSILHTLPRYRTGCTGFVQSGRDFPIVCACCSYCREC